MIQPGSVPLERVLGADVGAIYRDVHLEHGVRLLTGAGVERFEGDGAVQQVKTSDGTAIACDFVVVGIGVAPRATLAEAAGLRTDNGIVVDQALATDAPNVQYDVGMEYSGFASEWDDVVFRGDPASREFIAFWLQNDRVVAGMNFNVWDVNEHVQALIRSRQAVNPAALADTDTTLDALVDNHESSIQA